MCARGRQNSRIAKIPSLPHSGTSVEGEKKISERSERSYKDVAFLRSNQCVAWYMSDIIAFKNIIFSLKVKWMSVKLTSYVCAGNLLRNYAKMEGSSGIIRAQRVCFTLPNCFYFIPHHQMMYVQKSPFGAEGRRRSRGIMYVIYESHFSCE